MASRTAPNFGSIPLLPRRRLRHSPAVSQLVCMHFVLFSSVGQGFNGEAQLFGVEGTVLFDSQSGRVPDLGWQKGVQWLQLRDSGIYRKLFD